MAGDPVTSPVSPTSPGLQDDGVTHDCLRSLGELSGDARNLQKLLSFFHPEAVHESVLTSAISARVPQEFGFLFDDTKFLDAKNVLLKARLIGHVDYTTISVSHLAQHFIYDGMLAEETRQLITIATELLIQGFPNPWASDLGNQFASWKRCEIRSPHVMNLVTKVQSLEYGLGDSPIFADLVLRCCWYLYEREKYNQARSMIHVALQHFPNKNGLAYASALDLRGLISLETGYPLVALEDFTTALIMRQKLLNPNDALIASSLNNLGLAYTESNDLPQATNFHDQAIELRLRSNSDRIGNSWSNMSSTLLRLGRADEAEEMLFRSPLLKGFYEESFLDNANPRSSGDMIILSRIRLQQGRIDEALRLAARALLFRQRVLGNTPKTCDVMCLVADLLHKQEKIATARSLLHECINIAGRIPDGAGYLAKAQYKLAKLYDLDGDAQGAQAYFTAARSIRDALLLYPTPTGPMGHEDDSFDKLVPWMLW
ncbi:hypothetical protein MMC30_001113 [Trapelia coarctata]|nr:hypothetical protein [Trapelia coarctata]